MKQCSEERESTLEELRRTEAGVEAGRAAAAEATRAAAKLRDELAESRALVATAEDLAARASNEREAAQAARCETERLLAETDKHRAEAQREAETISLEVTEARAQRAEMSASLEAAEEERARILLEVQELRKDFENGEQVELLRTAIEADLAEVRQRLEQLQNKLKDTARSAAREEVEPLRRDLCDLRRQVGEHAELLQMLQMKGAFHTRDGDLSPMSSRSASNYDGSDHGLSSVGVSSGRSTPNGGLGVGRILRGGSFCSSASSDSGASSNGGSTFGGRAILRGRSFASSDAGDDNQSERSFGGESAAKPLDDDSELMAYAQALKPLLVTRKDIARVLSRVPEALLNGTPSTESGVAELRELINSIFGSVVVILHIHGRGDCLCFCSGVIYSEEQYTLGRLNLTLQLKVSRSFAVPKASSRRPAPVPEESEGALSPRKCDDAQKEESAKEATASAEPILVKLTDISSRDLFLAELVGPFGAVLKAAALESRCSTKALRSRRHSLRHAKDALGMVLNSASKEKASSSSFS
jgi:hypothetical protein